MAESLQSLYRQLLKSHNYKPPSLTEWVKQREATLAQLGISAAEPEIDAEATHAISIGEPPINQEIGRLANEIEHSASEWQDMSLPCPVLCRAFPGVDFNAIAVPTSEGALLLVNEGLVFLVYHCLEIWARAANLPDCPEVPLLSSRDGLDAIVAGFVAYCEGAESWSQAGQRFPVLDGVRGSLVGRLAESTCRFVVGHEYGHVYAGHVTAGKRGAIELPTGVLDVIPTNWQEEYRADVLAMRLVLPPSRRTLDSDDQLLEAVVRVSGPMVFFPIAEILGWVSSFIDCHSRGIKVNQEILRKMTDRSTHPPPVLRIEQVRKWADVVGGSHTLEIGEQFLSWLTDCRKSIFSKVVGNLVDRKVCPPLEPLYGKKSKSP